MPKVATRRQTFRFDQMAKQINDRIDNPAESGVERYVGLEHLDADSLRIRRWGEITDVESTKLRFQPGDIIFGKRRVYQRKLAVADFEGICSAHAMVLRARSDVVLPEFLPFFMQSDHFMERALQISVGSLSPTINWKTLAAEEFALPPIEVQQRVLPALNAASKALGKLSDANERHQLIGRRIMEGFQFQKMPFVCVGDLLSEPLMRGWSVQCNDLQRGRATLPAGCIYTGIVDTRSNLKYAELDEDTFEKYRLCYQDVLLLRGNGNRALVGRAGVVCDLAPECFFPDLLVRLRFDRKRLAPELAALLLDCVPVHAGLAQKAKSTNGIWKIGFQDIREHRIPLPDRLLQDQMLALAMRWREAGELLRNRLGAARSVIDAIETDVFGAG